MKHALTAAAITITITIAAATGTGVVSQQTVAPAAQGRAAPASGGIVAALFTLLDANKDGTLEREEARSGFDAWYARWDSKKTNALGVPQIYMGLSTTVPAAAAAGRQVQSRAARPEHVAAMVAALPDRAPAKPRQPRRVLVV